MAVKSPGAILRSSFRPEKVFFDQVSGVWSPAADFRIECRSPPRRNRRENGGGRFFDRIVGLGDRGRPRPLKQPPGGLSRRRCAAGSAAAPPAAGGHSATVCGCPASRRRCRTERPGRRPPRRRAAATLAGGRQLHRRSLDTLAGEAQTHAAPRRRQARRSAARTRRLVTEQRPEPLQATERRSEGGPGGATPRTLVAAPDGLPARLFSGHALRCSRRYVRDIRGGGEAPRQRGERPAGEASPGTAPAGISTKPRRGKRQPVRHGSGPCRSERRRTALSAASSTSEACWVCPHRPPCPEPPVEPQRGPRRAAHNDDRALLSAGQATPRASEAPDRTGLKPGGARRRRRHHRPETAPPAAPPASADAHGTSPRAATRHRTAPQEPSVAPDGSPRPPPVPAANRPGSCTTRTRAITRA